MPIENLHFCSSGVRWASPLALGAIASLMTFSPASAIPIQLQINTYPNPGYSVYSQPVGQPVYGTTLYGSQTSYSSTYRSGGFGISIGGYSREYPYTYPSYYPSGYPSSSVILQSGYTSYPSGINHSILVNPTLVNTPIYNSTLINPRIIDQSRHPRNRYRGTTTIIRYSVPLGASGVTIPLTPHHPQKRHFPN